MAEHPDPPKNVVLDDDSDDGGREFRKDASNGLSHERMNYMRHINHPREVDYDIQTDKTTFKQHSLCKASVGCSHCSKRRRQTDFKEYGTGIVLYYQLLKYLGIMMFLFTILSIPNYLLFYHGSVTFRPDRDQSAV